MIRLSWGRIRSLKEFQPMSLLRLRIKGRLYAGFGALVLFGVALAGFAVWQLSAINRQVTKMALLSDNAMRVQEISTELQAMRRATLRYSISYDKPTLEEAEQNGQHALELLDAAKKTTQSDERRKAYEAIEEDVRGLHAKRAELVAAVDKIVAGKTALFAVGDMLAADVAKVVGAAHEGAAAQAAIDIERDVLLVRVAN